MKITDLTVTLFGWPGIPATTYGRHTGRFSGESQLGLVTVRTDDGLEGHAFLGSAMRGANLDAQGLIQYLKPLVIGQDPLDRERLWQAMWAKNRNDDAARDRRRRRRAVGSRRARSRACRSTACSGAIATSVAGVRELGGARLARGVCGGSREVQGRRLARVQDPSADRPGRRHRGVPRGAARRGRRLPG